MPMDGLRCFVTPECKKKCVNLHAHLITLPRDDQLEFLHSLTGKQRSELAATISNIPHQARRSEKHTEVDTSRSTMEIRGEKSKWNDVMRFSQVLDQIGSRRKAPVYTISRTTRFPAVRSTSAAALMGPGHYSMDCDFPLDSSESQAGFITRTKRVLGYEFLQEERTAEDGALKGNSTTAGGRVPHGLAPGSYNTCHVRNFKQEVVEPHYSMPRSQRKGPIMEKT